MTRDEDRPPETIGPSDRSGEVTAPDQWIALGLLCAGFFMDAVDITIIQVTLPMLQHALGFTEVGLQWVHTVYVLMFGASCSWVVE